MEQPPIPTQDTTIEALLQRSNRKAVPIRHTFVQQGTRGERRHGPLASLVSAHDERALKLWLLLLAGASHDPWDVTLAAAVWARAVGVKSTDISKVWRRLADSQLVSRDRKGREAAVTPLKEDGSGEAYTLPFLNRERYFKLPHAFWIDGHHWYQSLDLAETAVLLIALSLRDGFLLPSDKAKLWFGISADTLERGLRGLQRHGLLHMRRGRKLAPLSPLGYTLERRYTLQPPFGPHSNTSTSATGIVEPLHDFRLTEPGEVSSLSPTHEEVKAG